MDAITAFLAEHYWVSFFGLMAVTAAVGFALTYKRRTWIHRLSERWFGDISRSEQR